LKYQRHIAESQGIMEFGVVDFSFVMQVFPSCVIKIDFLTHCPICAAHTLYPGCRKGLFVVSSYSARVTATAGSDTIAHQQRASIRSAMCTNS